MSSQKAATMTVEPSEEQIQQVVAFGIDEVTAKRFLRVKSCDVQQAVNAIFDGDDIAKLESGITWDPSVYNTDRDGNANLHPLGANSTAPTRGNSPAASLKESAPTSNDEAEADLARALALSQETDVPYGGWEQQQETGTIGQNGMELRRIGPATKEEHTEQRWGMVLHNASEVIPDVPIEERVQLQGDHAPRFLKHTLDGDYTPNLITICHSIPMAREAFLLAASPIADYGHDANWWKGAAVSKPRIVHTDGEIAADQDTDSSDEFVAELQRLTAFLDCSARVYASVGGLLETKAIKDRTSTPKMESFLNSYTAIVGARGGDQADQIAGLFNTRAALIGGLDSDKDSTTVLTLKSSCADSVAEDSKPDLTECLDKMVWNTDADEDEPRQFCLERPANILVMRLDQEDRSASHLNITVPATLVMDKYIEENVPATRALREQLIQSKRRIKKITDVEKKLMYWTRDGQQLDSRQLLKHTHAHFSGQNRRDVDQADKTNNASVSIDQPGHYQNIADQLRTVMASIDEKLEILAEEKAKAQKAISELSKSTIPALEGQEAQYRYTLRGVATKPHITYVLRPKTAEEGQGQATEHNEEMQDAPASVYDEENTTPTGFQWWRIDYEVTGQTAKVTRSKADDFDVIRAVELEHNSALLVYASDDAVDDLEPSELPAPLQDFIQRDNEQLYVDIEASKRNAPPPYQDHNSISDMVRSSVETRECDDDNDSNSSMKPQLDGQDFAHGDDVNIIDSHASMPMSDWLDSENQYRGGNIIDIDANDPRQSDPPPVDIRLDEPEAPSSAAVDDFDNTGGREMEEKEGMPSLIPARGASAAHPEAVSSEDVGMSGMGESQDLGIGGATSHVEEVRKGG